MTNEKAIKIIENEQKCVYRANVCNRHCATCDLVMKDIDILMAYEKAIHALKYEPKYCKSSKRFKRKYLFLKFAIKKAIKEIDNNIDADAYTQEQFNIRDGLILAYNILIKYLKGIVEN